MKSLPAFVADMKATAELLREQADGLDELVKFFGGAVQVSAPQVPIKVEVQAPPPPPVVPPVQAAAPVPMVSERPVRMDKAGRKHRNTGRLLTKAEKKEIKEDWDAIPPPLRTKLNRAALAAKYNCTAVQVYAITRDPEELKRNLQGGRAAKEASRLPPQPLSVSRGAT